MNDKLKTELDALFVVYDDERDAILRYVPTNEIILYGDYRPGRTPVAKLRESLREKIYKQEFAS